MSASTKPRTPSKKTSMREQVYQHLRHRMRRGEYSLEDRLVDHEIAAGLAVSRMPVREALLQLKNEGLLEGSSRGFRLRQFTPADIAQIFEIRVLLEPAAARQACEHACLEGIGQMQQAVQLSEEAHQANDPVAYMAAHTDFRTTWIRMVPNQHLASNITRLADHVEAIRLATLRNATYRGSSLASSQMLLEGFLKKDPVLVENAIHFNLRHAAASYYAVQNELTMTEV